MPQDFESPFLEVHSSEWIAANDLAFAIYDKFPVSKGHTLVISKRLIATWFDASGGRTSRFDVADLRGATIA